MTCLCTGKKLVIPSLPSLSTRPLSSPGRSIWTKGVIGLNLRDGEGWEQQQSRSWDTESSFMTSWQASKSRPQEWIIKFVLIDILFFLSHFNDQWLVRMSENYVLAHSWRNFKWFINDKASRRLCSILNHSIGTYHLVLNYLCILQSHSNYRVIGENTPRG